MTVGRERIRVLHVDDEPEFAEMAATFLEREGEQIEVVSTPSVESALERLGDGDVDCVLSDYEMPDRNGIEFLECVRERYPDVPFVLFTGRGSEEVASSAISAGVTDYLQKGKGTGQFKLLANRIENAVSQHRAERAVERGDERLRAVIDHVPHPVFVMDEELEYRLSNTAHSEIHGRRPEEVEGATAREILDEESFEQFREGHRAVLESNESKTYPEVTFEDASGESRYFDSRLVPFEPVRSGNRAILGVIVDVTDRIEREQTLERLHEVTRELLAADTQQDVAETTTKAVQEVLGYPKNIVRFVDEDGTELHTAAVSEEAREMLGDRPVYPVGEGTAGRAFASGETLVFDDVREIDDDYDRRNARASMYLPIGEYGTLSVTESEPGVFDESDVHLAEIFAANAEAALDRVEQARARKRQNERLEEFTSIVSHDLQNPLNVLSMSLELAEEQGNPEQFARCQRAVDRMEQLIDDLLTLARDGETVAAVEPVELAEFVEQCWGNVETGGASLDVRTDQVIRADPRRLGQVLENFIGNAVQHGSTTTPREAGNEADADDGVTVAVGPIDDGFYVEDDGPGVPVERRERVFESGYSTADGGTGFGLTIVERIAEAHGWTVRVTDGPDGGARFEVTGVTVER